MTSHIALKSRSNKKVYRFYNYQIKTTIPLEGQVSSRCSHRPSKNSLRTNNSQVINNLIGLTLPKLALTIQIKEPPHSSISRGLHLNQMSKI